MATIGQTPNDGHLLTRDTNNSNTLAVVWNEDDTSDRTLNVKVNAADRTLEVLGDSKVNQDLQTTASPTHTDVTLSGRDAKAVLLTDADKKTTTQVLTDGQILIGSTGNAPAAATLTQGAGVTITNGAGTITIAASAGGLAWSAVDTNTNAVANNGYITTHAANRVVITLPTTFAVGNTITVVGSGAGMFQVLSQAGNTIKFGALSTKDGGYINASVANCAISMIGLVANTTWGVVAPVGKFDVEVS